MLGVKVELQSAPNTGWSKSISICRLTLFISFTWPDVFVVEEENKFGVVMCKGKWYLPSTYAPARPFYKRFFLGSAWTA